MLLISLAITTTSVAVLAQALLVGARVKLPPLLLLPLHNVNDSDNDNDNGTQVVAVQDIGIEDLVLNKN